MTWQGKRRASLPGNWRKLRAAILHRDPTCQLNLAGCTVTSTEVDHIGDNDDHRPGNLRGVCTNCHKLRTQQQSRDARPPRRRPRPRHPGEGPPPPEI